MECKAPGRKTTRAQEAAIAELRGLGVPVLVVDNLEAIDRLFGGQTL